MFLGIVSKGDSYVLAGISDYGWESGNYLMDTANKASDSYSCFFLESQPVYRPGQTARFKGVLFRPDIANPGTKDCAGKKLTLTIVSPTGDESIFLQRPSRRIPQAALNWNCSFPRTPRWASMGPS